MARELERELIAAVKRFDPEATQALLDAGADPNARDEQGNPVLWCTLRPLGLGFVLTEEEAQLISKLIAAGADPKLDDVGVRMCRAAWGTVCSGSEAYEFQRLVTLLGVPRSAIVPSR